MPVTLEDSAKLAVHELRNNMPGPDAQTEYVLNMLRLIVADEREACAKEADQKTDYYRAVARRDDKPIMLEHALTCEDLARVIRARK